MKILKYIIVFILILSSIVGAQESKYGGAFLELGIGPRALGMGSAYAALAEGGSGFYWNPGGAAFGQQIQVSAMYANLFNSLENHGFVGFSLPLFGGATVGGSWIRLAVDDIPRYYDPDLTRTWQERNGPNSGLQLTDPSSGSFAFSNNAYVLTFSRLTRWDWDFGWQYFKLPVDVGYGLNFKFINMQLDNRSASGIGVDAGIRIKLGLDNLFADDNYGKLSFGISAQDLFNTKLTWDTDSKHSDTIERNWRFGFAISQPLKFARSDLLLAYEIDTRYDTSNHFGLELNYQKLFAVRIGSNNGEFTTGAGVSYWHIRADYAFQIQDLGNSHRVGLAVEL